MTTIPKVCPFLMFEGKAQEAMDFYVSLLPENKILELDLYDENDPGPEGSVKRAAFTFEGQTILCTDSWVKHDFTFTPSMSLFITCSSSEEIHKLYTALSQDGKILMALGDYGFSQLFGWVNDRFGVSWQLTLPRA